MKIKPPQKFLHPSYIRKIYMYSPLVYNQLPTNLWSRISLPAYDPIYRYHKQCEQNSSHIGSTWKLFPLFLAHTQTACSVWCQWDWASMSVALTSNNAVTLCGWHIPANKPPSQQSVLGVSDPGQLCSQWATTKHTLKYWCCNIA